MKLSMAVPSPEDVIFYSELEKEYQEIANLGYFAIEPLVNNPNNINIKKLKEILIKSSLRISGLRTGLAYTRDGLSFSNPDVMIRKKAIKRLKDDIVLASKLNTSILVGLMQGKLEKKVSVSQAKEWIVDSLIECTDFAQNKNVMVKLEPVNRYQLNYNNTVSEIIEIIDKVKSECLSLLIDSYHMYLEEKSITDSINLAHKYISHVYLSGSNRDAPSSTGEINFTEIIKSLKNIHYEGFIAIECNENLKLLEVAESSIKYLLPLIKGDI